VRIERITHPSGDQLPLLLDRQGLPIPAPNEFILARRELSTNTLERNLRELSVLYRWLEQQQFDLCERIQSGKAFTEAEIKGGLVEKLRRDQTLGRTVRTIAVSPSTFNQRLTTVCEFLKWCFDCHLSTIPFSNQHYERIRDNQKRVLDWLTGSLIRKPPINTILRKGLTEEETQFLVYCIHPKNSNLFGRDSAVRFRNYIIVMIMLLYGLRPGELLSLRVEDIEFGAISGIRVVRRPPDLNDLRSRRPSIKRNSRILCIDNPTFAKHLDEYIMRWRENLESRSDESSDYLIISDEGSPLSQSTIVQLFQTLRDKFPEHLPPNLSAKSLRHTFSANLEREMRTAGLDEGRRAQALAHLRGDSSLPPSRLLERAMVYTALSRCKQRCIILAPDLKELAQAVANPPSYETRKDRLFYEPSLRKEILPS
jgi:integrase